MDDSYKPGATEGSILGAMGVGAIATAFVNIWIALVILLLLVILVGGYIGFRIWKKRRQQHGFDQDISQHAAGAPSRVRGAQDKAALDKLRASFNEGINVYKSRGKDLYSVPWYIVIGTSGSGKTEAIRHSNIGFPPGLNKEQQGVGGTINMNWWFTNHGVILDTAGKMVFPEAGAGDTPEWEEFLKLLKKSRANCPINGLFLTLPVDSLIGDSAELISRKAGQIAQKIDLIQRTLDVRFPVFILVTMCDRMVGFREYFEAIEDPQLQHQILGWSNPDALDAPFRPELVEDHLTQVIDRLRRRRLALVREPVTLALHDGRRQDATDGLYALSDSFSRLGPRLRRYLETIFIAGEFSSKPVFLRGIYFTSAMRQGAELDEALAQVMGRDVKDLPQGFVWGEDKAYFLRDVFLEKAFLEKGLVTAASDTRKMLRNRKIALFGCGFFALVFFLMFSWFGWRSLRNSIGQESQIWSIAENDLDVRKEKNQVYKVVVPAGAGWAYGGATKPSMDKVYMNTPMAQLHKELKDRASKDLKISWIFKPLYWMSMVKGTDINNLRVKAQHRLVDDAIIFPMIKGAEQKMASWTEADIARGMTDDQYQRHLSALKRLIEIEGDIAKGSKSSLSTNAAQQYVASLLSYLTETNMPADMNLTETIAWTYSEGDGKAKWPPALLSGGTTNLAGNPALDKGIKCFIAAAKKGQKNLQDQNEALDQLCLAVKEYRIAESAFLDAAERDCSITDSHFSAMQTRMDRLNAAVQAAEKLNVFKAETSSLKSAFDDLRRRGDSMSTNAVSEIKPLVVNRPEQLFKDIELELTKVQGAAVQMIDTVIAKHSADLDSLDVDYLAKKVGGSYSYQQRFALYMKAKNFKPGIDDPSRLVGQKWVFLTDFQTSKGGLLTEISAYTGSLKLKVEKACSCQINTAEKVFKNAVVPAYLTYVRGTINNYVSLKNVDFAALTNAQSFFARVQDDVAAGVLPTMLSLELSTKMNDLPAVDRDLAVCKGYMIANYCTNRQKDIFDKAWNAKCPEDEPVRGLTEFADYLNGVASELSQPVLVNNFPREGLDDLRTKRLVEARKYMLSSFSLVWQKRLEKGWGLPVLIDGKASMTLAQLKDFNQSLIQLDKELAMPVTLSYPQEEIALLKKEKTELQGVVSALLNEQLAPVDYKVRLLSFDKLKESDRSSAYKWRGVKLNDAQQDTTKNNQEWVSGKVNEPLNILVWKFMEDAQKNEPPVFRGEFPQWGIMQLIGAVKAKNDPAFEIAVNDNSWVIPVPVNEGKIIIEVQFKKPLPMPGDWPNSIKYRK